MKFKTLLLAFVIAVGVLAAGPAVKVSAEEVIENAELVLGSVKIFVNGKRVRKQTLLYNDFTYLPLRALAEALGKEIAYDAETVTAHINNVPTEYEPSEDDGDIDTVQNISATIFLGRTKLMVDGQNVPQETLLYNDSAYAPLRAVAEMMNMDVSYDDSIKSAMLYEKGAPAPKAINYYEDFPMVIDFGDYAGLSEDSVRISVEEDGTKYFYIGATDGAVAEYKDAILAEGFELTQWDEETDICVYKKENATVTVDNFTYNAQSLMVVSVQVIEPFSYPDEFPNVPLFSPEKPDQIADTDDGRGVIYTFYGIPREKLEAYVDELIRLGYSHNTALSAADNNIYNLDEISVSIDATRLDSESVINIMIRDEIFLFQKEFPTVPTFAGIKPESTTPSDDGKGFVYWYTNASEDLVNGYIGELSRLGYITDAAASKAGYYAYKQGDITVIIDTITYKSTGYVLLTITKEINVVYYPNYLTVPSFPARIETTSPTEDGTGTIYWHLNVPESMITDYADLLLKLGYTADGNNTRDGFLVYVKDDISVTLDSVTRQENGFFLLAIKKVNPELVQTTSFIAYRTYPSVPDIGSYASAYILPFNVTKDGDNVETYWYYTLENEIIQNYLKALIDNKFTNIAQESSDGYWVYQKDDLVLTVDTSSYPNQFALIKIDTNNVVNTYPDMPEVPDFATVVKKYWSVTGDRIGREDQSYIYTIRDGNADSASGYLGDVSLFAAYTEYIEGHGYVLDATQPAFASAENETRRDALYAKGDYKLLVTESIQTDEFGGYAIKITIRHVEW